MIVVVEGPSTAGKTTWCGRHAASFVAEYAPTGSEPGDDDPVRQADYRTTVNSGRWAAALRQERIGGSAVSDSDPLKLHYSWCLAAIGAGSVARFHAEAAAVRSTFAARRLGFADLVLVTLPPVEVLVRRRDGDPTRRRRHFALHSRLTEPLRQWYGTVDRLEPGRVAWELPETGLPEPGHTMRPSRYDLGLFDALLCALSTLTR